MNRSALVSRRRKIRQIDAKEKGNAVLLKFYKQALANTNSV
jgi:hypothetical protein